MGQMSKDEIIRAIEQLITRWRHEGMRRFEMYEFNDNPDMYIGDLEILILQAKATQRTDGRP